MYAIDPIQKLRLLRQRIVQTRESEMRDVMGFHRDLAAIFLSTRDLHTNYFLPSPFSEQTAFVPFLVEDFFEEDEEDGPRRFLVTRVFDNFSEPPFGLGVEILRWNGVPIERAVEINGQRFVGSNPEASRARGIETLTVRSLVQSLPPEEDFVLVEYQTPDGAVHELRVDWFIFSPDTSSVAAMDTLASDVAVAQGIDMEQALVRLARKVLFAPDVVAQASKMAKRKAATKNQGLSSMLPDVLHAQAIQTNSGEFGNVRIRTFSVRDADSFVNEFVRLVEQLPQEGLIIDVRGNGGGLILAGEQLLQVLTPRRIEPTLFQLRNTSLNLAIVEETGFLSAWRESMRQSLQTGAAYSKGFPITSPAKANAIGQRYHGPVVLITDGLCYSTTDIFAAGFQDHGIGTIVGVDNNTGAGGANVWGHDLLSDLAPADSPYEPLPSNAGMRVAIRRTIRVGRSSGSVVEDLGVRPDTLHRVTRDDLLNGNVDLIEYAAGRLGPARKLDVTIQEVAADQIDLNVNCLGVGRLDLFADSRPLGSVDVQDGDNPLTLSTDGSVLDLQGFDDGELVAARRVNM